MEARWVDAFSGKECLFCASDEGKTWRKLLSRREIEKRVLASSSRKRATVDTTDLDCRSICYRSRSPVVGRASQSSQGLPDRGKTVPVGMYGRELNWVRFSDWNDVLKSSDIDIVPLQSRKQTMGDPI